MFLQNITHSILSLFNQNSAPVSIKTRSSYNCLSDKINSVLRPPKLVLSLHFDDRKKDAMVYFANMSISEGSMAFTCTACRDGNAYSRDGQSLADCDHRTFFYKQPNTNTNTNFVIIIDSKDFFGQNLLLKMVKFMVKILFATLPTPKKYYSTPRLTP